MDWIWNLILDEMDYGLDLDSDPFGPSDYSPFLENPRSGPGQVIHNNFSPTSIPITPLTNTFWIHTCNFTDSFDINKMFTSGNFHALPR